MCDTVCRSEDQNTEQERMLVDDITAPGGVKAAPPRDSLNKFISRFVSAPSLSLSLFSVIHSLLYVWCVLAADVRRWTRWLWWSF